MLPGHHGRGQHGHGDQPGRQNFKSGHLGFSNGYGSQDIWLLDLEMSRANGGLNEKFVHGRSLLREAGTGNSHKIRRSPQAVARERRFDADISIIGVFGERLCIGELKCVKLRIPACNAPSLRQCLAQQSFSLFRASVMSFLKCNAHMVLCKQKNQQEARSTEQQRSLARILRTEQQYGE
jgi:hypothetical protein